MESKRFLTFGGNYPWPLTCKRQATLTNNNDSSSGVLETDALSPFFVCFCYHILFLNFNALLFGQALIQKRNKLIEPFIL